MKTETLNQLSQEDLDWLKENFVLAENLIKTIPQKEIANNILTIEQKDTTLNDNEVRLNAIKHVKSVLGLGLKEAKDLVDYIIINQ